MVQKFEWAYDDKWLQPANMDQIGWAGVPLKDTEGYTGMIKRASVPTNDILGFDPEYASVDVEKIVTGFTAKLNDAFESDNVDALTELMYEDGWWKDVHLLTWDVRSIRGRENIKHMLSERLAKTGIKKLVVLDDKKAELEWMGTDLAFLTVHIGFSWKEGTGSGFFRLSPTNCKTGSAEELADVSSWQLYHIATTIDTLRDVDPESGDRVRYERAKIIDPLGLARTYRQIREDEQECRHGFEPTAIIVGAGQSGLMLAARLKVIGISALIIEKGATAGASWTNRYASLSLHNTTATNHFPYIPYPTHFPDFIPAQQLGKFMENYTSIMDFNIWYHSTIDGENAVYDEEKGRWTVTVNRDDAEQRILHPKYLIVAVGITGTLPALPKVPGLDKFEANGGAVVHSSRHRTTPDMKGKKAVVVGAATSAHDLCWELYDNGLDVTMIQRTSTHVISVEPGVRMMYGKYETIKGGVQNGGYTVTSADRATWLGSPYPIVYELAPRLFKAIKEADKPIHDAMEKHNYRFNDGFHGGGAASLVNFNLGGYFFDTGFCKIVGEGKIRIEHAEVDHLEEGACILKDGTKLDADLVIYANGYFDTKTPIQAVMGDKMAEKCDEWMEKGNSFIVNPEGELRTYWRPLAQKGLFCVFQQFAYCRYFSARLALNLMAQEMGLDVTPYSNYPFTPRTAVARGGGAKGQNEGVGP